MKVKLTERDIREAVRNSLEIRRVISENQEALSAFDEKSKENIATLGDVLSSQEEIWIGDVSLQTVESQFGNFIQSNRFIYSDSTGSGIPLSQLLGKAATDPEDKAARNVDVNNNMIAKIANIIGDTTILVNAVREIKNNPPPFKDFKADPADDASKRLKLAFIRMEFQGKKVTAVSGDHDKITVVLWDLGARSGGGTAGDAQSKNQFSNQRIEELIKSILGPSAAPAPAGTPE